MQKYIINLLLNQKRIIACIAWVVLYGLRYFGIDIPEQEIIEAVTALVSVIAVAHAQVKAKKKK